MGDKLYLVRDQAFGDGSTVEVRTERGELLGFVPGRGDNIAGRFGPRTTSLDLAAALEKGAFSDVKVWGTRTAPTGTRTVTVVGTCDGWKVPHPVRLEQAKKLGHPLNRGAEPLPFAVGERRWPGSERTPPAPPPAGAHVRRAPAAPAVRARAAAGPGAAAKLLFGLVGFLAVFAASVYCLSR